VGIALQPAITTAVEAAVHSSGRGKVTVSATLKNNRKEARVRARKKVREIMQPGTGGEGVGRKEKMRTHMRPDFQLSGTEN
jgi:hypothetical protein